MHSQGARQLGRQAHPPVLCHGAQVRREGQLEMGHPRGVPSWQGMAHLYPFSFLPTRLKKPKKGNHNFWALRAD